MSSSRRVQCTYLACLFIPSPAGSLIVWLYRFQQSHPSRLSSRPCSRGGCVMDSRRWGQDTDSESYLYPCRFFRAWPDAVFPFLLALSDNLFDLFQLAATRPLLFLSGITKARPQHQPSPQPCRVRRRYYPSAQHHASVPQPAVPGVSESQNQRVGPHCVL